MTDMFVLLLLPGGGDELQGIKRGIVELADLILVNKADGEMKAVAERSATDYRNALNFMHSRSENWDVPVECYSSLDGSEAAKLWGIVQNYRDVLDDAGALDTRRADQAKAWMWSEVTNELVDSLKTDPDVRSRVGQLESDVTEGKLSPTIAAQDLIDTFLKRTD
jgi:LAO/AO transport system kinase